MENSVIVLSSSSSDDEDERLREAKRRKCGSNMDDGVGVGVRSAKLVKSCGEDEFKVLSDLTGFQNLAAMMAAEAFMRRRKKKRRKKKNKNNEMNIDVEKKGVQENIVKAVETTKVVETEIVPNPISENLLQKLTVDGAKEDELLDTHIDGRKMKAFDAGDGVRSDIVIDLCSSSVEEDEVVADLSSSRGSGGMILLEPIVRTKKRNKTQIENVDASRQEERADVFKDVETSQEFEVSDGIGSVVVIDLSLLSSEDDEVMADLSKSRGVEGMLLAEPIIDVAKGGQQPDTVVAVGTTKALETSSIPTTALLPQKLFEKMQVDMDKGIETVISKDNTVLRKLLRGPRYFDPPEKSWGTCCRCGEEGHPAVNCTVQKRKKPCFFCGDLGHIGKKCKQGRDCFFCKGKGHIAKDCPEKHLSKVCLRCGDSGHDMWSCNSDYSPDDLKEIECYVCKSSGHLCCFDIPDMGTPQVSCYNCGQTGHLGSGCTKLHGNASGSRSPAKCFRCGEEGHVARRCKKFAKVQFNRYPSLAEKTAGNLSTPQKFPKEKRDFLGSKSAPQDLCKAQNKKKSQYEERDCMVAGQSWRRDGWIADQPGNLFCREARANVWMSPSAHGHFSSPQYPYKIFNHYPASTSSQAYQQRFQTSSFVNFNSG